MISKEIVKFYRRACFCATQGYVCISCRKRSYCAQLKASFYSFIVTEAVLGVTVVIHFESNEENEMRSRIFGLKRQAK